MNIIFIAPPAAGKGTQSIKIKNNYNLEHISTGDLLRIAAEDNTPLGKKIKSMMEKGVLVNDEIIIELLEKKLSSESNYQGFILDGYPRNIKQADYLEALLNKLNKKINYVFYLNADYETLKQRIVGRVVCPACGATYNLLVKEYNPIKEDVCDKCHHSLIKRSDDNENTFKNRYDSYLTNSLPLIEYYKNKNILYEIKGNNANEVYERITNIIDN